MNNSIDRQYLELVNHILRFGYDKKDRTGTGTKSLYGWQIRHRMSEGFPLLTTKKMAWKTLVTELLWFLRGDTNIKYLVDNGCHIWDGDAYKGYEKKVMNELKDWDVSPPSFAFPEYKEEFINKIKTDDGFAKKWGELGPIYGKQWRSWTQYEIDIPGFDAHFNETKTDQIADVIHLLKTDPDSRRMIVNSWNVGELDQMVLPPCHMMFQFYTRELSHEERYEEHWKKFKDRCTSDCYTKEDFDKKGIPTRAISLMWVQRSVDVGLGLPFNIASYALLLEIIAKEVNMVPEELIGSLGDCHIYNNHVDGLNEQLERIPYELPNVKIKRNMFEFGKPDPSKLELDYYSHYNFELENYQSHPAIKLPLSN